MKKAFCLSLVSVLSVVQLSANPHDPPGGAPPPQEDKPKMMENLNYPQEKHIQNLRQLKLTLPTTVNQ
jgi:hypothetical protein